MAIKADYVPGDIPNALKELDDESVLKIIRLACASNDLATNFNSLGKFPEGENAYFFYNSISIVREIAKLIEKTSSSTLKSYFSSHTQEQFDLLEKTLVPFHDESVTKSVLKPIRDVNFHYNFPASNKDDSISELINVLKASEQLTVGVKPKKHDLLSVRYTFADWFRNEFINSHLDSDLVKTIATVSVGIVAFLDSLMADIISNGE